MAISRSKCSFILIILFLWPTIVYAVSVKPSIDAKNLTVGDKFVYRNELPAGSEVESMPLEGKLGDAAVLSPIFKVKSPKPDGEVFACTLAVYQPGEAKIPTFSFRQANSSDTTIYSGDTLTINIASVLPPDTTGLQMADIRGPRRLRGPIWPYLVAPIVVALIALGIIWLRKKLRRKISEPSVPPIPPWEMAFKRLDELKASRHLDFGRFKQFYFDLSMIIRIYIEERFETLAVESTTLEIKSDARLKELEPQLYDRLFELFNCADMVKFAKSIPTAKEAESDLAFAYDFVVRTKPAPVAPEGEKVIEEVKA